MWITTMPVGRRLGLLVVVVCCGCGPRPPAVHPAGGRILFQGAPVAGFMVEFSSRAKPTEGLGANGLTDSQGGFTLRTRFEGRLLPGVVSGPHRVVVIPPPATDEDTTEIVPVPIRYADYLQSGLTAEVTADGANDFTFDLKP